MYEVCNISREEKIRFLSKLSLFCVPARVPEAFGLYVIEAMAATVPVVLPSHGSFPELIEKTEGGVLYDHTEKGSLSKVLAARLDDHEATQRLGKKGRVAVQQNYSNEKLASQLVENILAPVVASQ